MYKEELNAFIQTLREVEYEYKEVEVKRGQFDVGSMARDCRRYLNILLNENGKLKERLDKHWQSY